MITQVKVTSLTNQGSSIKKYNVNLNDDDIWEDIKALFVNPSFTGYITVPGVGFKQVLEGQYTTN